MNNRTEPKPPLCAHCPEQPYRVNGDAIYVGRSDLREKIFWMCHCGAYCGSRAKTQEPVGTTANAELRALRKRLHDVIDPIWRNSPDDPHYARRIKNEAAKWAIRNANKARIMRYLAFKFEVPEDGFSIETMNVDQANAALFIARGLTIPALRAINYPVNMAAYNHDHKTVDAEYREELRAGFYAISELLKTATIDDMISCIDGMEKLHRYTSAPFSNVWFSATDDAKKRSLKSDPDPDFDHWCFVLRLSALTRGIVLPVSASYQARESWGRIYKEGHSAKAAIEVFLSRRPFKQDSTGQRTAVSR